MLADVQCLLVPKGCGRHFHGCISGKRGLEMSMTDPIADMLTRIRNATKVKSERVDIPASSQKMNIAKVLKNEGYIKNFKLIKEKSRGILRLYLKYGPDREAVIEGIQRVSKPGRRIYTGYDRLPRVRNGLGIAIVSTSRGVMTDREARRRKLGGEILCSVW